MRVESRANPAVRGEMLVKLALLEQEAMAELSM
jgi:hypothetical protein